MTKIWERVRPLSDLGTFETWRQPRALSASGDDLK
jgi:hypothetical protein